MKENRDLPDPLGWADLVRHPDLTADIIRQRSAQGRIPQRGHRFPLPKSPGSRPRTLMHLDHFDDLALRSITGRLVPKRSHLYDSKRVLSAPVEGRGPGWRIGDHRKAHQRRRREASRLLAQRAPEGMGVADTKDYFGSVDPVVLAEQLLRAGCPPGAVHALQTFLQATADATGVSGLPIGCEASAFLGSVYLAPVDAVFAQRAVPHRRWTDDVWAFPDNESTWDEVLQEYRASHAQLGLQVNDDKTRFLGTADAVAKIQNPVVDYLLHIVGGGTISAEQAADELALMLAMEAFGEPVDPTALRFCVGVLNSKCAPDGLRIIEAYPEWVDREPTAVGRYLVTLARDQTTQRELDIDWLTDLALRVPTGQTVAGSVQALRTLSHLHLPASVGRGLFDVATDRTQTDQVPLQEWAAWAWHRSEAWKPRLAAEAAEATGHLSTKRAFTAGLRRGSGSASVRKCLDRLARQEPELAPTIAWAR